MLESVSKDAEINPTLEEVDFPKRSIDRAFASEVAQRGVTPVCPAERLWEHLTATAGGFDWDSTLAQAQALRAVTRTVEKLENIAKPLGSSAIVAANLVAAIAFSMRMVRHASLMIVTSLPKSERNIARH